MDATRSFYEKLFGEKPSDVERAFADRVRAGVAARQELPDGFLEYRVKIRKQVVTLMLPAHMTEGECEQLRDVVLAIYRRQRPAPPGAAGG